MFAFFNKSVSGWVCRAAAFAVVFLAAQLYAGALQAGQDAVPAREIWRFGEMSVVAIQDLPGEMAVSTFKGPASESEKAKYFNNGKTEAGFNVFLLRTGGRIALFDTGNGTAREGRVGNLPKILASLGVKPEEVEFILLTHMHMDHIGGLLDNSKKRAFPRARLMVSKPEIAYWTALAARDASNANAALVSATVGEYGADVLPPFSFGDVVLPGVTALDASGHTPGHTVFQLEASPDRFVLKQPEDTPGHANVQPEKGGNRLLVIGDLVHGTPLQFAMPEECAVFDVDPPKAILARKRILNFAEQNNIPVAGMHMPFPAYGKVEKDGKAWKFSPAR
ncbi:MAG: MBL fold metallo-hydrolase [Desulfovibrio sp.]|jgi:hypothetical protein|nr:MBL fold metallo-hydrolase [Desulfovibrio sp.]